DTTPATAIDPDRFSGRQRRSTGGEERSTRSRIERISPVGRPGAMAAVPWPARRRLPTNLSRPRSRRAGPECRTQERETVKNILLGLIAGVLVGGVATWTFFKPHEAEKKEEHKTESRVQHGTNGEPIVKLDRETQTRVGLKTAALEAAQMAPEIKGYGRVLDPAPIAAVMIEFNSAQASLEVSRQEYERVKKLNALDQNASARSLQMAEAAAHRDQILLDASRQKILATLGAGVLARTNL